MQVTEQRVYEADEAQRNWNNNHKNSALRNPAGAPLTTRALHAPLLLTVDAPLNLSEAYRPDRLH